MAERRTAPLAVVTGAASGIGAALARELDARGYRLALCDIRADRLEAIGAALADATGMAVDVGDGPAVEAFARAVLAELGTPALVIHNAGVSLAQRVEDMALADLEWVMRVNFWGMVHSCRAFLAPMLAAGGGTQVFVSSIFGIVGVPTQSAYNASKFAIRGFAEALRQEVEGRMDVLVVCPGGVRTDIVKNGRIHDWPTGLAPGFDPVRAFEQAAELEPGETARAIVAAVGERRGRLLLGRDARTLDALQRLMPIGYAAASRRLLRLLSRGG